VPRLREVVDDHLVALFAGDATPDGVADRERDNSERTNLLEKGRLDQ
jgi:hypothetical protein